MGAFVALIIAWALDESVVFTISARVAQVAFLVAFLGAPFSRYLRRSRAAWVAAPVAIATAVVAGLAA